MGEAVAAACEDGDDMESSRRNLVQGMTASAAAGAASLAALAGTLPRHVQVSLAANVGLSAFAFVATTSVMQGLGSDFIKAGLKGIDLNKRTTRRNEAGELVRPIEGVPIPESQGTVCATVYILTMSVFIPFAFAAYDLERFPHVHLAEYLAAVLTITFASLMGFADDVLDLRWRHKIPLPFLATLPLILVYRASGSETGVMVPNQLRGLFGDYVDLGIFFYAFLLVLANFSTHAINIYAGVNGLEVGQSVVIGVSVLIFNIVQLHRIPESFSDYREHHVQSLFLVMPFLAVSLALMRQNWWPARYFVGDTYCYFAGMTFAVICIVGHFSKMMCLFLLPQVVNFLYSCPQLFRFIPIPRHRMPAFDPVLGYVKNSYCEFKPDELRLPGRISFLVLRALRLADVRPAKEDGMVQMSNLTLINLALYWGGSCREDQLCMRLLTVQAACSVVAFMLRFGAASCVFDVVL